MPSPKMYKNRIKTWGLSKYLTQQQAERIVHGEASVEDKQAAQRSLTRRRTRRHRTNTNDRRSSSASDTTPPPPVQQQPLPTRPIILDVTPPTPQPQPQHQHQHATPSINTHQQSFTSTPIYAEPSPIKTEPPAAFQSAYRQGSVSSPPIIDYFLVNLRRWTHEAFVSGHWEGAAMKHNKGRHASRRLASDLQAGIRLQEQGNSESAWLHWRQAFAHFQDGELFKTWYHETPVRLLFEVSRIHHQGHSELAKSLLTSISDWAETWLDKTDPRHALYKLYGDIPVDKLRFLHERSARCMLDGLSSRLDKNHSLLYEVRLNRALDMIWFDPAGDLGQWLPALEEVDRACGANNVFSVYYLLLQAYQLVACEEHEDADNAVTQARQRITAMGPDNIDGWRLAMAYRRLGRMQYTKRRWPDARRSFNTALRYVDQNGKDADSIMVEVFQCQENMAKQLNDLEDAELWRTMLKNHEQRIKEKELNAQKQELAHQNLNPSAAESIRRRSPSPRPLSRSNTMPHPL